MLILKCKMCGGNLNVEEGATICTCEYCGTTQTIPNINEDKIRNLYDRANGLRQNGEFDRALGIYETILLENPADAEAYWSLVLCRYGIEYVEDPSTKRMVPTINRLQFVSIYDDQDYKQAIGHATALQKEIYEEEAKTINDIQKETLLISSKEKPFDVFICYKETDEYGNRTKDSEKCYELYDSLTKEGLKVFFARITLESKLGSEYEPYIFAALNSARVMIVFGSNEKYFNAPWVKNEWSRYLNISKKNPEKTLIPVYENINPYDLPDEFSHLQAQDYKKIGAKQDIVRGIIKLVGSKNKDDDVIDANLVAPLIRRMNNFLSERDFASADKYAEKILDIDPENKEAYLGKFFAEYNVNSINELITVGKPFIYSQNYKNLVKYGDSSIIPELEQINNKIVFNNELSRKEEIYNRATIIKNDSSYKKMSVEELCNVIKDLDSIGIYNDSQELLKWYEDKRKSVIATNKTKKIVKNIILSVSVSFAFIYLMLNLNFGIKSFLHFSDVYNTNIPLIYLSISFVIILFGLLQFTYKEISFYFVLIGLVMFGFTCIIFPCLPGLIFVLLFLGIFSAFLIYTIVLVIKNRKFNVGYLLLFLIIGIPFVIHNTLNKSYTNKKTPSYIKVSNLYVNVRKEPSIYGKHIYWIFKGEEYDVLSRVTNDSWNDDYTWYTISFANGLIGYVASSNDAKYVEEIK